MKDDDFSVLRCEDCGDTFPAGGEGSGPSTPGGAVVIAPTCPSCGSGRVVLASEPLL